MKLTFTYGPGTVDGANGASLSANSRFAMRNDAIVTGIRTFNALVTMVRPLSRMARPAAPMPTVWSMSENERATSVGTERILVKTGNATAPPPCGVVPATKLPNTMVSAAAQWSATRPHPPPMVTATSHTTVTAIDTPSARRDRRWAVVERVAADAAMIDSIESGAELDGRSLPPRPGPFTPADHP